MSDSLFQLQNINIQIKNLSSLYETMLMQMNGMNNIGNQLENIGIQMINMGIQLLNIGVDENLINNLNLNQQIQNMKFQLNNIEVKQNMRIQNNQSINFNPFQMNNNMMPIPITNNDLAAQKKMKITFKNSNGEVKTMIFEYGKTVEDIMKAYLSEYGLKPSDRIYFLYNASRLNFDDKTKIEKKFEFNPNPRIIVVENTNLIG